jgi:hypothetical protein
MMRGGGIPSASATRVKKKDSAGGGSQQAGAGALPPEAFLPIIGNVVERSCEGSGVQRRGISLSSGGKKAFPEATHRSLSKFKFARAKGEEQQGKGILEENVGGGVLSEASVSGDAEAMLQSMSADEIESARKELLARLPKKTVEFLKTRGSKSCNDKEIERAPRKMDEAPVKSAPTPGPIVERLRFSIEGRVVDIAPLKMQAGRSKEKVVLQRDLIRQSEGSVDGTDSYTILECTTLARSTDANQRVLGLRFLSNILKSCRDIIWEHGSLSNTALVDNIPEDVQNEYKTPSSTSWIQVWQHALYSAQVTKVIRYALDDEKIKVIVEACRALNALVGLPRVGKDILIVADTCPAIGLPKCPVNHMQRSDDGAWVSMPLDIMDQKEYHGGIEEADEQDVARFDPISGLLNMRVLHRMVYLLQSADELVSKSAKIEILQVIFSFCAAGDRVMTLILETPRLLGTLVAFLPPYTRALEMDVEQILVNEILTMIVASVGEKIVERDATTLTKFASNALISWVAQASNQDVRPLVAIMKLWRALKNKGRIFTEFDGIYKQICFYLFPLVGILQDGNKSLTISRESYLIAEACVAQGHISSQCYASLLKDTVKWLDEVMEQYSSIPASFFVENHNVVHEVVAACLHFLQSCWQYGNDWEQQSSFDEAKTMIQDCIRRVSSIIIVKDAFAPEFWHLDVACTPRMAVICSTMNMAFLTSTKIPESVLDEALSFICINDITTLADNDIMQPWEMPKMQGILQLARLVDAIQINGGNTKESLIIGLRLVSLLPPGSDHIGLRLISHMFSSVPATAMIEQGFNTALHESKTMPETLSVDTIEDFSFSKKHRIDALTALSRCIGYDLQDASQWGSMTNVLTSSKQPTMMDGYDSNFPLKPTWFFAHQGISDDQSASVTSCQGILAWVLGLELQNVLEHIHPIDKHKSLFNMIFISSGSENNLTTPIYQDSMVRLLSSVLLLRYLNNALSKSHTKDARWTVNEVRSVTEKYMTDSYGDALFGCFMGTLLCDPLTTADCQEEVLSLLKDGMAMHYLPTIEQCIGPQSMYQSNKKNEAMRFQFLLDTVSSQSFARALETQSVVVNVVMNNLAWHAHVRSKDKEAAINLIQNRLNQHQRIPGYSYAQNLLDHECICTNAS